jgi:hypothetical protein
MDTISTYLELEQFIESQFEQINGFQYAELLRETLGVYALKPDDKETALAELRNYVERYGTEIEKPLFLEK